MYTQEQINNLENAIAKGERTVTYADRTVTYRSVEEMLLAMREMKRDLMMIGDVAIVPTRQIRITTNKGF